MIISELIKSLLACSISVSVLGAGLSTTPILSQVQSPYPDNSTDTLSCLMSKLLNPSIICSPPTSQPTTQPPTFNGSWQSRSSPGEELLFLNVQDDGRNIKGTVYTAGYDHTIEGTHNDSNQATVTVYRTSLDSRRCTTRMYGNFTSLSPNTIMIQITGTDGRCDLPSDFRSVVIYNRR